MLGVNTMLNSMTGYGSSRMTLHGREISIDIRSVNHKFTETTVRSARVFAFLEDKIRKHAAEHISRGKIDINVSITAGDTDDVKVTANIPVINGYLRAITDYTEKGEFTVRDRFTYSLLMRIPDAFTVAKNDPDEETLQADVITVFDEAIKGFNAMRRTEGGKLGADIEGRLQAIEGYVKTIDVLSPESAAKYRAKLTVRLQELLSQNMQNVDESRILTETAIFADKTAVFEETVRLKSHIEQFRVFLSSKEPIGRKMDFLTQEMNREANTIGSKAQDLEITRLVLEMKSDIEKIREQVQNIE
jgi:uncharacterized protein (TIGR00255 family)